MAKNEFDFDFDFENEYSSDPASDYDSEFDDMDLSDFDTDALGMDMMEDAQSGDGYDGFDLDDLDLGDADAPSGYEEPEEDTFGAAYEEGSYDEDYDQDYDSYDQEADYETDSYEEPGMEADYDLYPDEDEVDEAALDEETRTMFDRRASFFGQPQAVETPDFEQPVQEEPDREGENTFVSAQEPQQEAETPVDESDLTDLERNSRRRQKERKEKKDQAKDLKGSEKKGAAILEKVKSINFTMPPIFSKLWKLYFPPKEMFEPQTDPNNPRRRRKKSKMQIFKEAYLPAILAGLTLALMLFFVAGSISNAVKQKRVDDNAARESSISAANQAELIKSEAETLLQEAALQAQSYDYDAAITTLNSFSGDRNEYPEMVSALSEYVNARDSMVEFNSPSTIPNLSFHVLIADPARAYADKDLGGLYNRNFVTTEEFQRILEQLYKNNYILVDFDSFVSGTTDLEGNASFFSVPIKLPEGKKPVMITETMVNYYSYMIDGNKDGVADAGGDGFASRLVVDSNGDIKAEYVDINSQTQVGNYDLVPILEDFIKQYPDFSYRGARATLAVTGDEGIFGWRCNTTYIASVGQAYYDEQVAGAKEVVNALRNKGYRIASYSYKNEDYGQLNANQIQADLTLWNDQITPILGPVDTIVFAKQSDIRDYSGPKFNVLYTSGFRYMVNDGEQPYAEVNNTYVRQTRLMVTGNTMAWKSAQFTSLSLFDPNIVLDMTNRKQVPN